MSGQTILNRLRRFGRLPHARQCFISYRRKDGIWAQAVHEALDRRFPGQFFFDTDPNHGMAAGDWKAQLKVRLTSCSVVVALIGPDWAGAQIDGKWEIESEKDAVGLEMRIACAAGKTIIPVILDHPPEADLFAELVRRSGPFHASLAANHACPLRMKDRLFHDDMEYLAGKVGGKLISWRYYANLALVSAGAAYFALWLGRSAAEPWLALVTAVCAAAIVAILYVGREYNAVQVVRAWLSNPAGALAAFAVALLAFGTAASTPILHVVRGRGFSQDELNTKRNGHTLGSGPIAAGTEPIVLPLWWASFRRVGLDVYAAKYPGVCVNASPQLWGEPKAENLEGQPWARAAAGAGHITFGDPDF